MPRFFVIRKKKHIILSKDVFANFYELCSLTLKLKVLYKLSNGTGNLSFKIKENSVWMGEISTEIH